MMEIFTWRGSSIPDNAPDDEITRIRQEMGQLVEARQGYPGMDFSHVSILIR
jgi:hypothetical protein